MPRRSPHDARRPRVAPLLAASSLLVACAAPDAREPGPAPAPSDRTTYQLTEDGIAVETRAGDSTTIVCGSREAFEFRAAQDADGSWDPGHLSAIAPDATPGRPDRRQWVTALQVLSLALDASASNEHSIGAGARWLIELQRDDGAFLSDDLDAAVDLTSHAAAVLALVHAQRCAADRAEFADAAARGASFLRERELAGGGWARTSAEVDVDARATAWAVLAARRACATGFTGCDDLQDLMDRANEALASSTAPGDVTARLQRAAVARVAGAPLEDEDAALAALVARAATGEPVDAEAVMFAIVVADELRRDESYRRGTDALSTVREACLLPGEVRGFELYAGHAVTDGGAVGARGLNAIALSIYFRYGPL